MRVALENLLGNAWKFTGKRPEAKIEFSRLQHDGHPNPPVGRGNGVLHTLRSAETVQPILTILHNPANDTRRRA
jgi:hypothetical protein